MLSRRDSITSSVYTRETESVNSDCNSWIRPVTHLNPIVVNGEFSMDNPYLPKHPQVTQSYEITEAHLKIIQYEVYFKKNLAEIDSLRKELDLGKDLEPVIFNNLSSFQLLNDFFLKALHLPDNHNRLESILKTHLSHFMRTFKSYISHYELLTYGLKKLKLMHSKKLKKLKLEDDVFQYPIRYIEHYQKLVKTLDFVVDFPLELPSESHTSNDVKGLTRRYNKYSDLMTTLQKQLVKCPFETYLTTVFHLTKHCQLINESIQDPTSQQTPKGEKFFVNANRTVQELSIRKLEQELHLACEVWMRLCDQLSAVVYYLDAITELVQSYESYQKSDKRLLKNFEKSIEIERQLSTKLPVIIVLLDRFLSCFQDLFHEALVEISQAMGAHHAESRGADIVADFKREAEFKKMTILQASYNKEKVLKYYFNANRNDTIPMSPGSSFVINKFFQ